MVWPQSRAIAYALRGMRNPAKRAFGVFWWEYAPTKTPHFLSSVVGNRPNAIALSLRASEVKKHEYNEIVYPFEYRRFYL